jgi:hypothetical protein
MEYLQEQGNLRTGERVREKQSHPEEHGCADACCKATLLSTKLEHPEKHEFELKQIQTHMAQKPMSKLMPAVKSRCWRQNLKSSLVLLILPICK